MNMRIKEYLVNFRAIRACRTHGRTGTVVLGGITYVLVSTWTSFLFITLGTDQYRYDRVSGAFEAVTDRSF